MKIIKLFPVVAVIMLLLGSPALAQDEITVSPADVVDTVRQIFADMKEGNLDAIEKLMAPGFQAVREKGINGRIQELALMREDPLQDYTLSDIQVTSTGPVMIATYMFTEKKTVYSNIEYVLTPAPRMSVFLVTDTGLQWIANADLRVRPWK